MRLNLNPDLDELKASKKRDVDQEAETHRLQHITPGDAQMMVYLTKEQEAKLYLADPNINQTLIPHIVQEALSTGETIAAIAQLVVAMADQWRQISARIEAARQQAKRAIDAASTHKDVLIASKIDWSSL